MRHIVLHNNVAVMRDLVLQSHDQIYNTSSTTSQNVGDSLQFYDYFS